MEEMALATGGKFEIDIVVLGDPATGQLCQRIRRDSDLRSPSEGYKESWPSCLV